MTPEFLAGCAMQQGLKPNSFKARYGPSKLVP